jgi:hypothetical protein
MRNYSRSIRLILLEGARGDKARGEKPRGDKVRGDKARYFDYFPAD